VDGNADEVSDLAIVVNYALPNYNLSKAFNVSLKASA